MAGAAAKHTAASTAHSTTTPTPTPTPPHTHAHADHGEHPEHEAVLTGVIALANLFSNCVEAFELVHPSHRFDKQEQLLICFLGIQQARLLIWGDVVGVTSPPASVTDRAIPKHPSAAYPDLKEPTFFNARDPRLDDPAVRQKVDDALSAIVDRSAHSSREEMMEKYGLKPPKRFTADHHSALDIQRLEGFRERYELLKEVAESYAHINARRNSSIVSTTWMISDFAKFGTFIELTKEKVDLLIETMGVRERVDRGVKMDIRALGWHLSADRARVALDTSKLRLIQECCRDEYPEYVAATNGALRNIERERRENAADYNPYASAQYAPVSTPHPVPATTTERSGRGSISSQGGVGAAAAATNGAHHATPATGVGVANGKSAPVNKDHKKHGIFGLFKRRSSSHVEKARSLSVTNDPPRSMSDVGPAPSSGEHLHHPASASTTTTTTTTTTTATDDKAPLSASHVENQPTSPLTQPPATATAEEAGEADDRLPLPAAVRSKSVGDILDAPINSDDHEETRLQLERLRTNMTDVTVPDDEGPTSTGTGVDGEGDGDGTWPPPGRPGGTGLMASISVHDQYHGLGRQGTRTQYE